MPTRFHSTPLQCSLWRIQRFMALVGISITHCTSREASIARPGARSIWSALNRGSWWGASFASHHKLPPSMNGMASMSTKDESVRVRYNPAHCLRSFSHRACSLRLAQCGYRGGFCTRTLFSRSISLRFEVFYYRIRNWHFTSVDFQKAAIMGYEDSVYLAKLAEQAERYEG